ncbi:hypothetical protein MKW94_024623 [Papaver nudicaule]|uniref:Defensin n=1 Tax=Papaver nudicaule TaxID=74823 RepID=A0AA41SAP4_PAPNU|nr:hypothetical protein [Papaver nudicaule]
MAKAHHLKFSPFLVGFLIVLFVSDLGYVHSTCYPQAYIELDHGSCEDFGGGSNCNSRCAVQGIQSDSYACGWNQDTGKSVCICCIDG